MRDDPARRSGRAHPRARALCAALLLTVLGVAVAGCAANQATDSGYVDHNLDLPYWER